MEEVFQGLTLELTIGNLTYDVEKAYIDQNKHLFIVSAYDDPENPGKGRLSISDAVHVYTTDVKILDCKREGDKAILTCDVPPISYDFIRRSALRLRTDIPADYIYLKADKEGLTPISVLKKGEIKDLSPYGACIEINKDNIVFITNYKESPIYIKIFFTLQEENGVDRPMEIIGKVVNVKRSWKTDSIGVMFLTKSYDDYRVIEHYCHVRLQKQSIEETGDFRLVMSKMFVE